MLAAGFLEEDFAVIDAPQKGHSAASSSNTDAPHDGQVGRSIFLSSDMFDWSVVWKSHFVGMRQIGIMIR